MICFLLAGEIWTQRIGRESSKKSLDCGFSAFISIWLQYLHSDVFVNGMFSGFAMRFI